MVGCFTEVKRGVYINLPRDLFWAKGVIWCGVFVFFSFLFLFLYIWFLFSFHPFPPPFLLHPFISSIHLTSQIEPESELKPKPESESNDFPHSFIHSFHNNAPSQARRVYSRISHRSLRLLRNNLGLSAIWIWVRDLVNEEGERKKSV